MYSLSCILKKQYVALAVLLVLFALIGAALVYFPTKSQASLRSGSSITEYVKCYKSIEVSNHVSLWQIAEANMTDEYSSVQEYIREVKHINNMKTNQIIAGSYLVIPYYQLLP